MENVDEIAGTPPLQEPTVASSVPPTPGFPPSARRLKIPSLIFFGLVVIATLTYAVSRIVNNLLPAATTLPDQVQEHSEQPPTVKLPASAVNPTTSIPTQSSTTPTESWKTYIYQQVFEIKVPNDLNVVDKGSGRVEIGGYFSISTLPVNLEDCRGDCAIIETKEDRTVNGTTMRYLTGSWGAVGGMVPRSYVEYAIPLNESYIYLQTQELPFSTVSRPAGEVVTKVSEENTKLLDLILSTFRLLVKAGNWEAYSDTYYSVDHPQGWGVYTRDWEAYGMKFGPQEDDSFVLWFGNPVPQSGYGSNFYTVVSFEKPENLNGETIEKYITDRFSSPDFERTVNSEEYLVGGKAAYKVTTSDFPYDISIFIPSNDLVYNVTFSSHADVSFTQESQKIFFQILSTLKLAN